MERFFNTAGPQKVDINYSIEPLSRLDLDVILTLINRQRYFVLHAPRQTGKTSCMLALRDYLNKQGDYICVYANVEGGQAARNDIKSVTAIVCGNIARETNLLLKNTLFWLPSEQEYLSGSFTTATLYVPKGTKEKYKATAGWKEFTNIVEMEDDDPTNVEAITNHSENMVTERYALGGQRVSGQQRGLNIERMSDGTTKKVIVQ